MRERRGVKEPAVVAVWCKLRFLKTIVLRMPTRYRKLVRRAQVYEPLFHYFNDRCEYLVQVRMPMVYAVQSSRKNAAQPPFSPL